MTEIISLIVFIIGVIMRKASIISGSIFTTVSALVIMILYALGGTFLFNKIRIKKVLKRSSYETIPISRLIIAFLSGIALTVTVMGVLFETQKWPGAKMVLLLGCIADIIVTTTVLIGLLNSNSIFYKRILIRSLFLFAMLFAASFIKIK